MSSQKQKRYNLLLDEGLPPKEIFPSLNNYHKVSHIKHDFKMGKAKDPDVYKKAYKEKCLVVVFNTKHFKPLIKIGKPSVISLSTNLSNKQIDLKIYKMLKKLKHNEEVGHLISLTNENSTIERVLV